MSSNLDHLEPEGFKLFLRDKTGKEIAEILGVSEPTVSKWRNKYDWKNKKREWKKSNHATIEKLRKLRDKKIQDGDADGTWKIQKVIDSIDGKFDRLAYTLEIMEDFIQFMRAEHPEKFSEIQETLTDFFASQRNKYGT